MNISESRKFACVIMPEAICQGNAQGTGNLRIL